MLGLRCQREGHLWKVIASNVIQNYLIFTFRLNVDLCKARGVQPGPAYACLKAGTSVVISDGTMVW